MTDLVPTRHSLESVRADGWLDEILSGAEALARVAHLIGAESLALSIVAGAQVLELLKGPRGRLFVVYRERADGPTLEATAEDFTTAMARACLRIEEGDPPLGEAPTETELRAAVGHRTLLVAPLFGLGLEALYEGEREREIEITMGETRQRVPLENLRALVCGRVESMAVARGENSNLVPMHRFEDAETAHARGEHRAVVGVLGPLVGPIAGLSRRPEIKEFDVEARARIGRGLRQLALSLRALARVEEAESVLRVAIQWSRDDEEAAETYAALGELLLESRREGQAIGLLRRAHALGARDEAVFPALALALAMRGRAVAALGLVREAERAGDGDPRLERARALARERVGPAWEALEAFLERGFSDGSPGQGEDARE